MLTLPVIDAINNISSNNNYYSQEYDVDNNKCDDSNKVECHVRMSGDQCDSATRTQQLVRLRKMRQACGMPEEV